jgi:hypothetical protein
MPPTPAREGPLPLNTPLTSFTPFFTAAQTKSLSPALRKVTKRDLLLLASNEFTPATKRLTVQDISTLNKVVSQASARAVKATGGSGGTGNKCCCCCCYFCCCCTAVSVTRPVTPPI